MEELAFVLATREGGDDSTPSLLYADHLQETHGLSRRDALLRAVLQAPHAVGPRLAYADCLEAEGETERAAFCREPFGRPAGVGHQSFGYRRRLAAIRETVVGFFPKACHFSIIDAAQLRDGATLTAFIGGRHWDAKSEVCLVVRYGFVTDIGCRQGAFLGAAAALFGRHPVTDVFLTGVFTDDWRHASAFGTSRSGLQGWCSGPAVFSLPGDCRISWPLYNRLGGFVATYGSLPDEFRCYATIQDSRADLARACVDYGRDLVGLVPLGAAGTDRGRA